MPETAYVPDPRAYPLQWIPSQELDGGGSGETQVYTGAAAPTPDDPSLPALFYPTGGGSMQQWDVASQTWV